MLEEKKEEGDVEENGKCYKKNLYRTCAMDLWPTTPHGAKTQDIINSILTAENLKFYIVNLCGEVILRTTRRQNLRKHQQQGSLFDTLFDIANS